MTKPYKAFMPKNTNQQFLARISNSSLTGHMIAPSYFADVYLASQALSLDEAPAMAKSKMYLGKTSDGTMRIRESKRVSECSLSVPIQ